MAAGAGGVLSGIRVADFTRVLSGPYATMMLADFGADVLKIESPSGDETRSWRPPVDGDGNATYFAAINRNKRSVVCDLGAEEGLRTARRLAATADVVIENFRPGVMQRFGLGFEQLAAGNPRLVYCSITGFGAGAGAQLPGYDLVVQALGGLMSITGEADGPPLKVGVALVDVLTGLNAFGGILLALRRRDQGAGAQRLEVDLLSSLLAGLVNAGSAALTTGLSPARNGNVHPSIAPYETFEAADRTIAVAVGNDQQFAALTRVVGLPELSSDARFADNGLRVRHRAELHDLLQERFGRETGEHWQERLAAGGVPAGVVNSVAEAFELATRLGLGMVVGEEGGPRQAADPIRLSGAPATYRTPPPPLGGTTSPQWLDVRESDAC
jgi:crotonobetainyl-CoA:carnitine CoA-transferase CaiB-like acyl-CoA transferase